MDITTDDMDMFGDSGDDISLGDPLECGVAGNLEESGNVAGDHEERNPVKEHLLKQLSEVDECVDRTRRQIEETVSLKAKILRKFSSRAFYGESSSSDSESELFTATGEPIIKRKRKTKPARQQPLVVNSTWQHVTGEKWIVGVMLENTSDQDLYELDLHVMIKDVDEFSGVAAFWTTDTKSFWRRTDNAIANSGPGRVVGTVVVDLPKFTNSSEVEMYGTITYERMDEKTLQTLIPRVTLCVDMIAAGVHDLILPCESAAANSDMESTLQAFLSVKSFSIEKRLEIRIRESNLRVNLKNILDGIGLCEILPNFYVGRTAAMDKCMLEITASSTVKYRGVIYCRSVPQLNMLLHLLHDALPKGTSVACKNVSVDAVIEAVEDEVNLYLTTGDGVQLQQAMAKSDLMCEEFVKSSTIYCGQ